MLSRFCPYTFPAMNVCAMISIIIITIIAIAVNCVYYTQSHIIKHISYEIFIMKICCLEMTMKILMSKIKTMILKLFPKWRCHKNNCRSTYYTVFMKQTCHFHITHTHTHHTYPTKITNKRWIKIEIKLLSGIGEKWIMK